MLIFRMIYELFSANGMKKFAVKNRIKQGFRIKQGRIKEGFYCNFHMKPLFEGKLTDIKILNVGDGHRPS